LTTAEEKSWRRWSDEAFTSEITVPTQGFEPR
jgi:hypothetical protein